MGVRAYRYVVIAVGFWAALGAARVEAQSAEDSARAMLYLGLGGGGTTQYQSQPSTPLYNGSVDNDATVGLGGRIEKPLMKYFSLGGQVEMLSYLIHGGNRHVSGHFDLWAKGRYVFHLGHGLDLEAYVGVPIGFSVAAADTVNALKRDKRWLGWNIGAMAGGQLFFTERFGVMLEMGWRRVQVYNHVTNTNVDLNSANNQFACNLGGVILF